MKFTKRILALAVALATTCALFTGCTGHAELQFKAPKKGQDIAVMKVKDYGDIKIMLFKKEAPKAVENFTTHAKDGYFDGLTFHRVIADFMIQGGDPEGNGTGGESIWGEPFEDEFSSNLRNFTGALSMANSAPGTNGSQFFIVNAPPMDEATLKATVDSVKANREQIKAGQTHIDPAYANKYGELNYDNADKAKYAEVGGTPHLDKVHTVFGQVYEGMDIVQKIMEVDKGEGDVPITPVVIESVTLSKAE